MTALLILFGCTDAALTDSAPESDADTDADSDSDTDSDTDTDSSPDTGGDCEEPYTGPVYIGFGDTCAPFVTAGTAAIVWGCDSTDWWFDVYTVGWTSGGELWTHQTGSENPWDENHMIPVYDSDQHGWWDNLYLQLAIVDRPQDVVDGESTLYPCDTATVDSLTWHVVITDTDGGEADCAVWGDDPESLGTGCEDWN